MQYKRNYKRMYVKAVLKTAIVFAVVSVLFLYLSPQKALNFILFAWGIVIPLLVVISMYLYRRDIIDMETFLSELKKR